MKKSKLIATAVLASTLVLAGCDNGNKECSHVDEKAPWHYCDLCNAKMSDHTFGEWSVKTAATFDAEGVEHRVCSYCGEEETRAIPKLVHSYDDKWSHDDEKHWHSCKDAGYEGLKKDEAAHADSNHDHKCDACEFVMSQHEFSDDLASDASGHWYPCEFEGCKEKSNFESHNFNSWTVKTPASYEAAGVEARQCKVCDFEETRVIPQLSHTFGKSLFQGEDSHYYQCLDKGFEELRKEEESHSFSEWEILKEASYEEKGLKQRVCSVCGKVEKEEISELVHNFKEEFSFDEYEHWHDCTDKGYEHLQSGREAHVDNDSNDVCDVCNNPIVRGEVSAILINCDTTYFGQYESFIVSAEVYKTGFCDDTLRWFISKTKDGAEDTAGTFTIDQIDNYTIKVSGTFGTSYDSYARYIRCELVSDPSISDYHYAQGWVPKSSRVETLKTFMGTDYLFPYNYAFRPEEPGGKAFSIDGNKCSAETANVYNKANAYANFLIAFRANENFVESQEGDDIVFTYNGKKAIFEFHVSKDSSTTYLDVYKEDIPVDPIPEYNEFPMDIAMTNVKGLIACDIVVPANVNVYQVPKESTTITAFGDASEYVAQLDAAGYVKKVQNSKTTALSPDGTLQVVINDKGSYYTLDFSASQVPSGTDWSAADKEMMMTYFGEVLPFINYNYGVWYDYMDYLGYIYSSSTRVGAQEVAKAVFDAEPSFKSSLDGTTYFYEKSISKYENMVVEIISNGQISVLKEDAQLSTWEAEDIAAALGKDAKEALPALNAEGCKFSYQFGEKEVKITVNLGEGVVMEDYADILLKAGFTTNDEGNTRSYASSTDTLSVTISRTSPSQKKFTITANAHLPAGYSHEFPMTEISQALFNDSDLVNLPSADGTLFFFEDVEEGKCKVSVLEDGSMANYVSALENNGFVENQGVYANGNIGVELTALTGDAYSAKIYIFEKKGPVWPADEIAGLLEQLGFTNTNLPAPVGMTELIKDSYEDDGMFYDYGISGTSISSYISTLEDNDFYAYVDEYGTYIYDDPAMGWTSPCFCLYEISDNAFLIEIYIWTM